MRQNHYDYVLILFSFLLLEWGLLYFVCQWGRWAVVAGVALTFAALSAAANHFPSLIHGEKKSLNFKSTHIRSQYVFKRRRGPPTSASAPATAGWARPA